jgi:hypothetical protein
MIIFLLPRGNRILFLDVTTTDPDNQFFGEKYLWARQDSNLRPSGYEPRALPLSYGPGLSKYLL